MSSSAGTRTTDGSTSERSSSWVRHLARGALDENEWFTVFARLGELPGASEESGAGYGSAVTDAAAKGVVGIVDVEFGSGYRDWPVRLASGIDRLRVRTATYPDRLDDVLRAGLRSGDELPGGRGLLRMGPLKIISDGSLNTRTAYCFEPYADADSLGFPLGKQNFPGSSQSGV